VLWLALLLTIMGIVFTVLLARRGSRQVWTAAAGTFFAVLAVLGAASIGIFLMPIAALLLLIAAPRLRRFDRTT
jgi:hypothetical protein